MKKAQTNLHLLEKDILAEVISVSDMYGDDTYLEDDDFIEAYREFNLIRKASFLYEEVSEKTITHNFDCVTNESLITLANRIRDYNVCDETKDACIDEINYIIDNRGNIQ